MIKKIISLIKKEKLSKRNFSSKNYWENRYKQSGNSGAGSYDHLAEFKSEVLNTLLEENKIDSVIEFGCGDGNQLGMLRCKSYIGLDVSVSAIGRCAEKYKTDRSKSFFLYDYRSFIDHGGIFVQDCALSLDVLYHLVEREVYEAYLKHLFSCARRMVVIYAADMEIEQKTSHELYRKFTKDIEQNIEGWKLESVIKNKYPAKNYDDQEGSLADFFIYMRS
jgi:cyclopropane fatty-acyl-phospholipid synthase-like methyltransferase